MPEDNLYDESLKEESVPCPCEVPLQPMAQWVKETDGGSCRPCVVAPVVQWYHEQLTEDGRTDLAERLEKQVDEMDEENPEHVVALCETLDQVKTQVAEPTKKRLEEFDCAVQSVKLEEGELETAEGEDEGGEEPASPSVSPSDSVLS